MMSQRIVPRSARSVLWVERSLCVCVCVWSGMRSKVDEYVSLVEFNVHGQTYGWNCTGDDRTVYGVMRTQTHGYPIQQTFCTYTTRPLYRGVEDALRPGILVLLGRNFAWRWFSFVRETERLRSAGCTHIYSAMRKRKICLMPLVRYLVNTRPTYDALSDWASLLTLQSRIYNLIIEWFLKKMQVCPKRCWLCVVGYFSAPT